MKKGNPKTHLSGKSKSVNFIFHELFLMADFQ